MKDQITPFLQQLVAGLNRVQEKDKSVVVKDSKQISGTFKDQMLPLKQRLAPDERGAMVRLNLEATKMGQPTVDDESIDEEMIQMWADDIVHQHLQDIFKE